MGRPSLATGHWFGTDSLGRDLFARTVQGTQISLMVGLVGALIAVFFGTLYGAVAGYFGGRVDGTMMRIVDVLMSIPYMFVLILLLVVFGRSILMLFIGIGLISWLDMARIARGQTLALKGREFVEAAIATGVHPFRIILRHIVPNLLGVIIVYATLLVPSMIIYEIVHLLPRPRRAGAADLLGRAHQRRCGGDAQRHDLAAGLPARLLRHGPLRVLLRRRRAARRARSEGSVT